jgi:nucleotide-binding universal stress UspA family protein
MAPAPSTPLAVVGDDGSSAAEIVWDWVSSHAWNGWRIEVVTADERDIVWGAPVSGEPWEPPWQRQGTAAGAVSVQHFKYACDPRAMFAERTDASLLVVGRHKRDDRARVFLGSTSEWLLQHPPAPLVLVGRSDRLSDVVVCFDGSDHAEAALLSFLALPESSSCDVTVLTVDDGRSTPDLAEQVAARIEGRVATVASMVLSGNPTQAIVGHLSTACPSLVVIGTKGLTGWRRIRVGSTGGAVARQTPCNTLIASAEVE